MSNFISLDTVKKEMSITDENMEFDKVLRFLCDAVESLWDELTNRVWATASYTEYHDSDRGCRMIFLENYPVTNVESIYDDPDWDWGSDTLVDSDDYRADEDLGVIHSQVDFYEGKQSLKVAYTAGFSSSTVPDWLVEVLNRQVSHWYKQAKNQDWHIVVKTHPQGSSVNTYKLVDNLLPEFTALAERNRKVA